MPAAKKPTASHHRHHLGFVLLCRPRRQAKCPAWVARHQRVVRAAGSRLQVGGQHLLPRAAPAWQIVFRQTKDSLQQSAGCAIHIIVFSSAATEEKSGERVSKAGFDITPLTLEKQKQLAASLTPHERCAAQQSELFPRPHQFFVLAPRMDLYQLACRGPWPSQAPPRAAKACGRQGCSLPSRASGRFCNSS